MKAVILAGGLGTRLRPYTQFLPKPLLPIGESSVLEIEILSLKKHGVTEIFVTTYYLADYIKTTLGDGSRYGVTLHYSTEQNPLGTCGPVTLLKEQLVEPFILMNGDILTKLNFTELYRFALEQEADLTVVTKEITVPFRFGNVISAGDHIAHLQEKPDLKFEIMAGIYVLRPRLFELIPEGTYYGMDDLIRDMLDRRLAVARYRTDDYWLDIGQEDDYQTAQEAYGQYFTDLRWKYVDSFSGTR